MKKLMAMVLISILVLGAMQEAFAEADTMTLEDTMTYVLEIPEDLPTAKEIAKEVMGIREIAVDKDYKMTVEQQRWFYQFLAYTSSVLTETKFGVVREWILIEGELSVQMRIYKGLDGQRMPMVANLGLAGESWSYFGFTVMGSKAKRAMDDWNWLFFIENSQFYVDENGVLLHCNTLLESSDPEAWNFVAEGVVKLVVVDEKLYYETESGGIVLIREYISWEGEVAEQ